MKLLVLLIYMVFVPAVHAMEIPEADTPAAKLYAERCATCHALPHPKRLDWPHWRHMLGVMRIRMKERGMTMPNEDWRTIATYLKRHAR